MIGLFGGSFNPIHLGHLALVDHVWKQLKLDKIWLIPCGIPVHKPKLFFSDTARLKLVETAIQDKPYLEVDKREIKNTGKHYTIDTLKQIKTEHPEQTLCFIMGMDSFAAIKTWKNWRHLTDYAHLIVAARPNYQTDPELNKYFNITKRRSDLYKQPANCVYLVDDINFDISSSDIISRLLCGEDISPLVGKTAASAIKTFVK